ncbi:hypothetical protein [Microbispora rosea]
MQKYTASCPVSGHGPSGGGKGVSALVRGHGSSGGGPSMADADGDGDATG